MASQALRRDRLIRGRPDPDGVAQLRQELFGVVASHDVVRDRDPDNRRRLHRGIGSGKQALESLPHLGDGTGHLGDDVFGLDIDHADARIRVLIVNDESQCGIELVGAPQSRGGPEQAALEDLLRGGPDPPDEDQR